jgi:hypothetical protein
LACSSGAASLPSARWAAVCSKSAGAIIAAELLPSLGVIELAAPGQNHSARFGFAGRLGFGGEVVPGQNFVLDRSKRTIRQQRCRNINRPIDCLIPVLSLHSNVKLLAV